jgi:DNA-binding response OmpR family regulator
MKIVVAEDEEMLLKAMEFKLVKEGFQVIACSNGQLALEKIASEKPDIIITDIKMPFVNGLDIVRKIKVELKLQTPIIILSAVGLEKTVEEAFDLGVDDFITKPFSPNELIIRVKRLLVTVSNSVSR